MFTNNSLSIFGNTRTEDALLTTGRMIGKVFYVNTSGNGGVDTNGGLTPNDPLLTIEAAIGKCTDDAGDYVFVMDCYSDDDFPILIDKSTCHIIGMSLPNSWGWAVLGGDADVFQMADNYIELAGLSMVSAGKDGIHILAANSPSYEWIHHCNFAVAALSLANAIEFDASTGSNCLIEDCHFGNTTSHITGYGITGPAVETTIRRNVFKGINTVAINLTGTITAGNIYDNFFAVTDDAHGEAISLAAGISDCMVVNNIAMNGMLNSGWTYNPFRDLAADNTSNHWAMNYRSNAVIEPIGA